MQSGQTVIRGIRRGGCRQRNLAAWWLGRAFGHVAHAQAGVADKVGQQVRFRQQFPVFLRHFLPHHARVESRRIEDIGVVRAPQRFLRIIGGRICAYTTGAERQQRAIPVRTAVRREDGPAHAGETAGEERCHAVHDVMLWLEPGHEGIGFAGDFAEAHECLHLVVVAAHGFLQFARAAHVGISGAFQQRTLACADAPQQAIE